jgi:hypothetical protein
MEENIPSVGIIIMECKTLKEAKKRGEIPKCDLPVCPFPYTKCPLTDDPPRTGFRM